MSFIVKKENGKLIFINFGGYETRNESTIWCLEQAYKIYNWKDFNGMNWIKNNNQIKLDASKYITLDDLVKTYSI